MTMRIIRYRNFITSDVRGMKSSSEVSKGSVVITVALDTGAQATRAVLRAMMKDFTSLEIEYRPRSVKTREKHEFLRRWKVCAGGRCAQVESEWFCAGGDERPAPGPGERSLHRHQHQGGVHCTGTRAREVCTAPAPGPGERSAQIKGPQVNCRRQMHAPQVSDWSSLQVTLSAHATRVRYSVRSDKAEANRFLE